MSWRTVVITSRAKLDLKLNYMVIRGDGITRIFLGELSTLIIESTEVSITACLLCELAKRKVKVIFCDTRIFLGELSTLIIESTEVSITACLLCELAKRKVKVIFCDEKRNPCFEAVPYNGSHDTSAKIRKQIKWDKKAKDSVWTDIVTEKINQQMIFLKYLGLEEYRLLEDYIENIEYRDETNREGHASKVYFNAEKINQQMIFLKYLGLEEYRLLEDYIENIEYRDETNREGHASKVYFNALFGKGFTRNDESTINAALNYGYTILLSAFNREIVASGYLTQVGVFHDNMFNYFNLSSDLMEPFRILVDKEVYKMAFNREIVASGYLTQVGVFHDNMFNYFNLSSDLMEPFRILVDKEVYKMLDVNKFEKDEKMRLVNILNKEVVIDGKRNYVNNAIKIYCKSVFEAINENDTSLIKFYRDEL